MGLADPRRYLGLFDVCYNEDADSKKPFLAKLNATLCEAKRYSQTLFANQPLEPRTLLRARGRRGSVRFGGLSLPTSAVPFVLKRTSARPWGLSRHWMGSCFEGDTAAYSGCRHSLAQRWALRH